MTDFYGRPLRGQAESRSDGYFDDDPARYYTSAEPRENPPRRSPPTNTERGSTAGKVSAQDAVSPDLIASITEQLKKEITENVKKELLEHLKQTGTLDDQTRAPPMQRDHSNKSNSTSSPPPPTRRVYTPPSPTYTQPAKTHTVPSVPQAEFMRSPPRSPSDKPSNVRFSDREFLSRPTGGGRTYSTTELSTIDQKWGRLFNGDGTPTSRLGQFLRGLANHIIDDFPPKKSIVVTPAKMAAYYDSHSIDNDEPHPLLTIFRAQQNEHISRLYQEMGCQHHLVQDDSHSAPIVPALTPVGFAQWMTINILAYPDKEWRRLETVVQAMPVDADGDLVDGKPERLPKQISRYLLPEKYDPSYRKLLDDAILNFLDDLGSTSRRKPPITSPPLSRNSSTSQPRNRPPVEVHQSRVPSTTAKANPNERERNPYSGNPATTSDTSPNEEEKPVRIERDRAPYTAREGTGKVHGDYIDSNLPGRLGRNNSTSNQRSQPDIPEARHNRAPSNNQGYMPPPRSGRRRGSSPPLKSFSNSTPSDIHMASRYGVDPSSSSSSFTNQSQSQAFNPGSYGSTGSFHPPPGPPPNDLHRRSRDERDEDLRFAGEFTSPRESEKWDRIQESRAGDPEPFDRYNDRSTVAPDPRDYRGAPPEEWLPYREKGRGFDYEPFGRRY